LVNDIAAQDSRSSLQAFTSLLKPWAPSFGGKQDIGDAITVPGDSLLTHNSSSSGEQCGLADDEIVIKVIPTT
jgi:hypothetical protein